MANMDAQSEDIFEFTWTIENFSMCLKHSKDVLSTPWVCHYGENNLFGSFLINLVSKPVSVDHIFCIIKFSKDLYVLKRTNICILRKDGSVYIRKHSSSSIVDLGDRKMLKIDDEFFEDTLTLRFQIECSYDPYKIIQGTLELSNRLKSILRSGDFSDLILIDSNGDEHPVHKFLFRARAPKLMNILNIPAKSDHSTSIKVNNLSPPQLKVLLTHLYTGNIEECLLEEEFGSFFNICLQSGLNDIITRLKPRPTKTIRTTVRTVKKCITFDIKSLDLNDEDSKVEYVHFVDLDIISLEINVVLHRNENARRYAEILVKNITCSEANDEVHVVLSCEVSLVDDGDDCELYKDDSLFLFRMGRKNIKKNKKNWKLPKLSIENEQFLYSGQIRLKFKFNVSDGGKFHDYEFRSLSSPEINSVTLNRMHADFYNLYCASNTCFPDATLLVKGRGLIAHRALLAIWSPVFQKMFQNDTTEKQTGKVNITDIDYRTMENFLTFVYTGMVYTIDYDEYPKLYIAADKYEVTLLKEKCATEMANGMCVRNVCDILSIADTYSDEELLEAGSKFIYLHWKEVSETKQWSDLALNYPSMAYNILYRIMKKTNE